MKRKIIFLISFLTIASITSAIEVGGHLTEDTVWSPAYNPYLLISNIFVDEGITLTIQPGTLIKAGSALLNNYNYVNGEYFMLIGEESVAKMFWVDGIIIAEGSEQDSIIFSRENNNLYNHWGTIYFHNTSQKSTFKNCHFEYSSLICIDSYNEAIGAISGEVTELSIRNCTFKDNYHGILINNNNLVEIANNSFYLQDGINPEWLDGLYQFVEVNNEDENQSVILFSGNCMPDSNIVEIINSNTLVYNNILSNIRVNSSNFTQYYISENQILCNYTDNAYYQNSFINYNESFIHSNSFEPENSSSCSFYLQDGIISNNSFNNVKLSLSYFTYSEKHIFLNNIVYRNRINLYDDYFFLNNVLNYCYLDFSPSVDNEIYNCFLNLTGTSINYNNNIDFSNCSIFGELGFYNLMYSNCITMVNIPAQNNGGGNIQIEESALDSIYVNYYGNDFHLIEGSLAIDAGFNTHVSFYPFDMDYNHRVWDGDNNGSAIIDIGPYEFSASSLGGIEGLTYNPVNNESVDYVLIKLNNEPGEFTFSDSIGNFEYKLLAGIYDVYAERVFYNDMIEYQIEVIEGQFTQLDIAMVETVEVEDNTIIQSANDFNLTNYPNPFNPITTIEFSIQNNSNIKLSIHNIKGQKIRTLTNNEFSKGSHSIIWSGDDDNGKLVSSGVYFYKLFINGKTVSVKKCLLLK